MFPFTRYYALVSYMILTPSPSHWILTTLEFWVVMDGFFSFTFLCVGIIFLMQILSHNISYSYYLCFYHISWIYFSS